MKLKIKKWLGLLLLITLIGAMAQGSFAQTVIEFNSSLMGSKADAREALIADFEKTHPDIKVKHNGFYDIYKNHEKLLTTIVGGNPPDLVSNESFFLAAYAYYGAMEPLDMYLELSNVVPEQYFFESLLVPCMWEGKIYGVPLFGTTGSLFYNVEVYREKGLTEPPATWEELIDYAKKLTIREGGKLIRAGFEVAYEEGEIRNGFFTTLLWSNGGHYLNEDKTRILFDSEIGLEALQFYRDLFKKYRVCEIGWGAQVKHGQEPFLVGDSAMEYAEAYELVFIDKYAPHLNFKTARIPAGKVKQTGPVVAFPLYIPKDADNKQAAWKFIQYAISKEANAKFSKLCARLPSVRQARADPYFEEKEKLAAFIEGLEYATPKPPHPAVPEIDTALAEAMDAVLYQDIAPKQALDRAAEKANEALAQY